MAEREMTTEEQVSELRREVKELKESLAPVIEVWGALAGVARTLYWFGSFMKWVAGVGAVVFAYLTWRQNGGH